MDAYPTAASNHRILPALLPALIIALAARPGALRADQGDGRSTGESDVPPAIAVPVGHHLLLRALVTEGAQAYICNASGKFQLVAPTAMLRGARGQYVAHYAGPRWSYEDGGEISGKVVARQPVPSTIDALLLEVTAHSGPKASPFAAVDFIQRLPISGGVAPESCDPTAADPILAVPYRAVYQFWAPAP